MDISNICEYCVENDCRLCRFGNPCLGCPDYDLKNDRCTSNGACADTNKEGFC